MGKELVVYQKKIKRANIASKSKGIAKGNIWKKASTEQKFLGRTLPRMIGGLAKFAWKHPISTTAAWLVGEKLLKTRPGIKFPKHRQFDKRGRKFF
jgi:hypothetical protein